MPRPQQPAGGNHGAALEAKGAADENGAMPAGRLDRQRGLVTLVGELTNQDDKPVLRLTMTAFLAMRPL